MSDSAHLLDEITETMMNQETRRIRAEEMVSEVLKYIGARDMAQMLLEGEPDSGVESVERGATRGALSLDEDNGITRGTLVNVAVSEDEAFEGIRSLLLNWVSSSISGNRNADVLRYINCIEHELKAVPEWLQETVVQRELDIAERNTYDSPRHFEREIALRQMLAEKFGVSNRDERLKLWSEMLKFTFYNSSFAYEVRPSQESNDVLQKSTRSRKEWHQSSAKVHNSVLKRLRHDHNAELEDGDHWLQVLDSETTPMHRYEYSIKPMMDTEEFVWGEL